MSSFSLWCSLFVLTATIVKGLDVRNGAAPISATRVVSQPVSTATIVKGLDVRNGAAPISILRVVPQAEKVSTEVSPGRRYHTNPKQAVTSAMPIENIFSKRNYAQSVQLERERLDTSMNDGLQTHRSTATSLRSSMTEQFGHIEELTTPSVETTTPNVMTEKSSQDGSSSVLPSEATTDLNTALPWLGVEGNQTNATSNGTSCEEVACPTGVCLRYDQLPLAGELGCWTTDQEKYNIIRNECWSEHGMFSCQNSSQCHPISNETCLNKTEGCERDSYLLCKNMNVIHSDYFKCDNDVVIKRDQLNDGIDDCGDNTDERCFGDGYMCHNGKTISRECLCDRRKDCADFSDEDNCPRKWVTFCSSSLFTCRSSWRCLFTNKLCDGNNDCGDFSDEENCLTCPAFWCSNGKCRPLSSQCNGFNDCGDHSDEKNCPCDGFQCSSGMCFPSTSRCDGVNHCADGSDEANCTTCSGFMCANDKCTWSIGRCDGVDDCGDNSDETNCTTCREFLCNNSLCTQSKYKCDGTDDCGDNSDEENCPCVGFSCDNGKCVNLTKNCDNYDDCGNNSDESNCPKTTLSEPAIIGCSIAGIVGFVALLTAFLVCCRRSRQKRAQMSQNQDAEVQLNVPSAISHDQQSTLETQPIGLNDLSPASTAQVDVSEKL